jgi:protein-S-isoprenylcysteine O-methyltransferase Ste14
MWEAVVFWYFIASRLGYVVWVGWALRQQDRTRRFTREAGVEAGFHRFRRVASTLMNNDGVAFVILVLATRHTLSIALPQWVVLAAGGVMVAAGVGIKVWAASSLGAKAYYWHNFFAPDDPVPATPPGPYRYVKNPMYTLGYLQTYGLALLFGSLPALIASGFAQAAVLVFNQLVERPHYAALMRQARPSGAT